MSGHLDQEESRNPVGTQGDLMKVFKHQQIPGIDDIWFTGRSNVSYKVVASAAFNYDRPLMMAETYAAYQPEYDTAKWVYRTAMDQHAMGVNLQIGGRPGDTATAEMGRYVGRLEYLLRHGRHVADIAILYPIAALQADYAFAQPSRSSPSPAAVAVAASPASTMPWKAASSPRRTITWIWARCSFAACASTSPTCTPKSWRASASSHGSKLILDNKENREEFRVLIVPGGNTISVADRPEDPRFLPRRRHGHRHQQAADPNPPSSSRISKSSRSSARCSASPPMAR